MSSNQQTAGLWPSLHLPPFPLAPSDKSLWLHFCLLSHPCPHPSASPPPSSAVVSSPPLHPPLHAGASPAGQFGRLSSGAAVSLTQPFPFEVTQISWLALVSSTVSSSHAHTPILLISDFLLSALSTSAANLRAGFGAIFLLRLQSPLFHLITVELGWHVGKDKGVFSLPLSPRWQLDLTENCL